MRTSFCKQKEIVTIKLSMDEFRNLEYETERDDTNMVWNIIEECQNAISYVPNRASEDEFDVEDLDDILEELGDGTQPQENIRPHSNTQPSFSETFTGRVSMNRPDF